MKNKKTPKQNWYQSQSGYVQKHYKVVFTLEDDQRGEVLQEMLQLTLATLKCLSQKHISRDMSFQC